MSRGVRPLGEPGQAGHDLVRAVPGGGVVRPDAEDDVGAARGRGDVPVEAGERESPSTSLPPSRRLREMPAFSTAIVVGPPASVSCSASVSDHRSSASRPAPTPSVIESPIVTTAMTGRGTGTSTPVSTSHDPDGVGGRGRSPPRWLIP